MKVLGEGPVPTRIMLVGEAPSDSDARARSPFGGSSGQELNRLLHEAGIMRSECYSTYVCKSVPPLGLVANLVATKKKDIGAIHQKLHDMYVLPEVIEGYKELRAEIEMCQPNVIVALGSLALFALTGRWSVAKWRGSLLSHEGIKVIPTYPASQVFKQFELRAVILNDLRRVKRHMTSRTYDNIPAWNFIIRPTSVQVLSTLDMLMQRAAAATELWIEFDLETYINTKHIRCAGISWSRTEALCIPITDGLANYWGTPEEEASVVFHLYRLLTYPTVKVRGQNLLFDCQYTHRYWHFVPNVAHDTMISQHSCFSALPKGLDFLASMYCDFYQFWKDDK